MLLEVIMNYIIAAILKFNIVILYTLMARIIEKNKWNIVITFALICLDLILCFSSQLAKGQVTLLNYGLVIFFVIYPSKLSKDEIFYS